MLKEIREYYGLSQSDFALFLKMSRSQYSMAEINRRDYSPDIMIALLPLQLAIYQPVAEQTDEKVGEELAAQEEDLSSWIRRRKIDVEYKLQLLKTSLAKMKEDQARSMQIVALLAPIKAAAKPGYLGLFDHIENTARATQKKTGKNSQGKLEAQVQGLQAELDYLNNSGQ